MSKSCLITFSLAGSKPNFVSAAKSSGSLPSSQLPIFLPWKSLIVVMFFVLNEAIRVPERWKTCAMETRSVPFSRDWSILGSQPVPISAVFTATELMLSTCGPPRTKLTSRPSSL